MIDTTDGVFYAIGNACDQRYLTSESADKLSVTKDWSLWSIHNVGNGYKVKAMSNSGCLCVNESGCAQLGNPEDSNRSVWEGTAEVFSDYIGDKCNYDD